MTGRIFLSFQGKLFVSLSLTWNQRIFLIGYAEELFQISRFPLKKSISLKRRMTLSAFSQSDIVQRVRVFLDLNE